MGGSHETLRKWKTQKLSLSLFSHAGLGKPPDAHTQTNMGTGSCCRAATRHQNASAGNRPGPIPSPRFASGETC